MMKTAVLAAAALSIGLSAPVVADTANTAATLPTKIEQGKRCHKKGKVVTVGNQWHRVKLICKRTKRGDKKVLVWRYHGRA